MRSEFNAYMDGWRDGAGRRAMRIVPEPGHDYERGYVDGQKEHRVASEMAAEQYGIKLATIKAMERLSEKGE